MAISDSKRGYEQIIGTVSPVPVGAWQRGKVYEKLNIVTTSNASFMAKTANINIQPEVTADWDKYWLMLNKTYLSQYAYSSDRSYHKDELVYYPINTYGYFLRSKIDKNTQNPYTEGVLGSNWQLVVDFDVIMSVVAAETARVEAERSRITAENARKSNEQERVNAENARTDAETIRQSNELERINAESQRKANENSRIAAESARASDYNQMKSEIEASIKNINEAAENAAKVEEIYNQMNVTFFVGEDGLMHYKVL